MQYPEIPLDRVTIAPNPGASLLVSSGSSYGGFFSSTQSMVFRLVPPSLSSCFEARIQASCAGDIIEFMNAPIDDKDPVDLRTFKEAFNGTKELIFELKVLQEGDGVTKADLGDLPLLFATRNQEDIRRVVLQVVSMSGFQVYCSLEQHQEEVGRSRLSGVLAALRLSSTLNTEPLSFPPGTHILPGIQFGVPCSSPGGSRGSKKGGKKFGGGGKAGDGDDMHPEHPELYSEENGALSLLMLKGGGVAEVAGGGVEPTAPKPTLTKPQSYWVSDISSGHQMPVLHFLHKTVSLVEIQPWELSNPPASESSSAPAAAPPPPPEFRLPKKSPKKSGLLAMAGSLGYSLMLGGGGRDGEETRKKRKGKGKKKKKTKGSSPSVPGRWAKGHEYVGQIPQKWDAGELEYARAWEHMKRQVMVTISPQLFLRPPDIPRAITSDGTPIPKGKDEAPDGFFCHRGNLPKALPPSQDPEGGLREPVEPVEENGEVERVAGTPPAPSPALRLRASVLNVKGGEMATDRSVRATTTTRVPPPAYVPPPIPMMVSETDAMTAAVEGSVVGAMAVRELPSSGYPSLPGKGEGEVTPAPTSAAGYPSLRVIDASVDTSRHLPDPIPTFQTTAAGGSRGRYSDLKDIARRRKHSEAFPSSSSSTPATTSGAVTPSDIQVDSREGEGELLEGEDNLGDVCLCPYCCVAQPPPTWGLEGVPSTSSSHGTSTSTSSIPGDLQAPQHLGPPQNREAVPQLWLGANPGVHDVLASAFDAFMIAERPTAPLTLVREDRPTVADSAIYAANSVVSGLASVLGYVWYAGGAVVSGVSIIGGAVAGGGGRSQRQKGSGSHRGCVPGAYTGYGPPGTRGGTMTPQSPAPPTPPPQRSMVGAAASAGGGLLWGGVRALGGVVGSGIRSRMRAARDFLAPRKIFPAAGYVRSKDGVLTYVYRISLAPEKFWGDTKATVSNSSHGYEDNGAAVAPQTRSALLVIKAIIHPSSSVFKHTVQMGTPRLTVSIYPVPFTPEPMAPNDSDSEDGGGASVPGYEGEEVSEQGEERDPEVLLPPSYEDAVSTSHRHSSLLDEIPVFTETTFSLEYENEGGNFGREVDASAGELRSTPLSSAPPPPLSDGSESESGEALSAFSFPTAPVHQLPISEVEEPTGSSVSMYPPMPELA